MTTMRTLETVREELDRARERRDKIQDDIDRLGEGAGQDQRRENLEKGRAKADRECEQLRDEIQEGLAEGIRLGVFSIDSTDFPERRPGESHSSGDPRLNRTRDDALRANEQATFLDDQAKAHMEATLRADDDPDGLLARYTIETSSRDYYRAFATWMRDPVSGGHDWSPKERDAVQRVRLIQRAMSIGTTTAGGFLVPYELDPSVIIAGTGAVSPLRQISRVVTTAQNEKRFVTSLGVTSTWTDEAAQQTDDAPALLQPAIVCKKGAAFVPVSYELYEDSDIAQQVGAILADAKAVQEALGFTLTQTSGPTGIITALVAAGGSTVLATGSNALSTADLYANQSSLPPRWRPNASWMMNLSILNGFRQLPFATGLNYSIIDDTGPRPRSLGWPVYENSSMDGVLTGGSADYSLLSGDFSQFAIVDRVGTSIELIPNLLGANQRPTGQRGFYMHFRTGSGVLVADAFRLSNYST
jgi:HK97 family phage major capsid protein